MSDDVETTFAALPADIRLEILSALQDRIMFGRTAAIRDDAADVLVRFGYTSTAESAQQVRRTLDAL